MNHSWTACAVLAILVSGCASAPVRYYSLTPATSLSRTAASAPCCTVEMKNVTIPAEVDRPELVARYNDQQLDILGNDLWAAPLRDEIRGALLDHIRRAIADSPTTDTSPPSRRFIVMVEVQRFESVLAQRASIQAQWRVASPDAAKSTATTLCEATSSVSVTGGVPALVLGLQQALAVIGDRIVANILELRRTGVSSCSITDS